MEERFKLKCAVCLILTKIEKGKEYVLLQKRYNTGSEDNQYDVSSCGHIEFGETLTEAIIRETKEEIGVTLKPEDLIYNSTMHANFDGEEYIMSSFIAKNYIGTPTIMEQDKCNDLSWFEINNLPSDILENRKILIENYKNNNCYSEYGFDKIKVYE